MDADLLRSILEYDESTGLFRWKVRRGKRGLVGSVAGSVQSNGYCHIQIDGRAYNAHRLVWLYFHSVWPIKAIDHINGVRHDNRICNLREATHSFNMQNQRRPSKNNKSGFLGVSWHKHSRKWQASIRAAAVCRHLGYFDAPELAYAAYVAAKRQLHPFSTI